MSTPGENDSQITNSSYEDKSQSSVSSESQSQFSCSESQSFGNGSQIQSTFGESSQSLSLSDGSQSQPILGENKLSQPTSDTDKLVILKIERCLKFFNDSVINGPRATLYLSGFGLQKCSYSIKSDQSPIQLWQKRTYRVENWLSASYGVHFWDSTWRLRDAQEEFFRV